MRKTLLRLRLRESNVATLMRKIALLAFLKNKTESLSMSTNEYKIATLMDMGFPREKCIEAIKENSRYKTSLDIFPLKTFILFKS